MSKMLVIGVILFFVGVAIVPGYSSMPKPIAEENTGEPRPNGDPDGPWEGGLDDPTDFFHLGEGIFCLGTLGKGIVNTDIQDFDNIVVLIGWLCSFGFFSITAIFDFAEAFDIWEITRDGC